MKLLLINPFNKAKKGEMFDSRSISPPLGLGIIAGLTPDNWDIEIIDENFDDFQFKKADLVGITVLTSAAYRAYEIAEIYRKKGITTVLGGIHVSMLAKEAEQYADAIVIGEAEVVWQQLLSDFQNRKLKKRYVGELVDLNNSVHPRRDLFHSDYSQSH